MTHDDGSSSDGPAILEFHPRPLVFQVHYLTRDGRAETTIARTWLIEDARRCRLCAACTATAGRLGKVALCIKRVGRIVPEAEAELFRDPTPPGRVARGADQHPRPVA